MLLEGSTRTFWAGPDADNLRQVDLAPFESAGSATPFTGQHEMSLTAEYNDEGRVLIRQIDPLPLTILGILPNVELGG